jgi:hypothetical protein
MLPESQGSVMHEWRQSERGWQRRAKVWEPSWGRGIGNAVRRCPPPGRPFNLLTLTAKFVGALAGSRACTRELRITNALDTGPPLLTQSTWAHICTAIWALRAHLALQVPVVQSTNQSTPPSAP